MFPQICAIILGYCIDYITMQGAYSTSTIFHYPFKFTIFTDPEDALNLNCMKYYEIGINVQTLVSLVSNLICVHIS